jgi:hypothetical protein
MTMFTFFMPIPKSPPPLPDMPDHYYKRQFLREVLLAMARAGIQGRHLADVLRSYGDAYDDVREGVYDGH